MFEIVSFNGQPEIHLTRGDTAYFDIEILQADGTPYELRLSDLLEFTVKKSEYQKEALIHKTGQQIKIEPEDTNELGFVDYVFDVQLTQANGDVSTIIPPSVFRIMKEVTYGEINR